MSCGEVLIKLLLIANPVQVDENEIKLAIDLAARELEPGASMVLPQIDEVSRRELVRLIDENPHLMAITRGDGIIQIVRME